MIAKGVRRGQDYLSGLRDGREVWLNGKSVCDVTSEPGFARGAATLAGFFDKQFEDRDQGRLTYKDEEGIPCALAYQIPKSVDDIKARGEAYYTWARWSHGMFGRTPDYKNASVMAFAAARAFLAQGTKGQADFAQNMVSYYDYARKHDRVLTHTLVNPTVSFQQALEGKFSGEVALHVVKETDAGIIVKGARLLATLGPFSDDIEVFPSTVLKASDENVPFAFAFIIPVATPGLKMISRDSYDHQKSTFDAPLSSRFEEMDAVVIFDNVLVPWERVFMYGEPALCNQAFATTNAIVHMMHQVACAKLAKAEFLVGLLCSIASASGRDRDLYTKGLIAEVMQMTETIRALLASAEADAHEDQWGVIIPKRRPLDTARNLFPKFYPRMVEILQILGSSSLMATPSEADFSSDIAPDIERYFQLHALGAHDRVALFRLAHDVAISGFGSRQVLYERFFFGPPALMAASYYDLYDKKPLTERISHFLEEGKEKL